MGWQVTHDGDDITPYCSLVGVTLVAGAAAGGRKMTLKVLPGDSGFVPVRDAEVIFLDEAGVRRWAGRVVGSTRIDLDEVANSSNAYAYQVELEDWGALLWRRVIPPATTSAQRWARRLPPKGMDDKYDGSFRPLSTTRRIPIESALDWALALIETTEAANFGAGKGRILPAFQRGTATGSGFSNPDLRGVGHEMADLVRTPAVGTATYSASSNSGTAGNAADGDAGTYWQAGSGANPYWRALYSAGQTISMIRLTTGPTTAWGDMRVDLLDSLGSVITTYKFGAVAVNTTKQYIWSGDIPNVYAIRVRDAASSTTSGKGLARVSAYDTYGIYLTAAAKPSNRKGNPVLADTFNYGEVIDNICKRAQLGWYIDPGDDDGPILRTYSLTQPPIADYEIGDDPSQTPVSGSEVRMARSISLSESSANIVNRVVAGYGLKGSTKAVTVPDDPGTRRGLAALATASQTQYGLRERRLGDTNLTTKEQALLAAQSQLARGLGPEVSGTVRLPYSPDIVPGYRVRIHRAQHGPAISPKSYYVAVGFIKEVSWVFESNGTTPYWCDLTIADPDGATVGFVEGLNMAISRVGRAASSLPAGISRTGDEEEGTSAPEWGTYSTYLIRPQTAIGNAVHLPAMSSTYRSDIYNQSVLFPKDYIATTQGTAYYLPNVGGAHVDAAGRRTMGDGSAPIAIGVGVPPAAGAVVRARLFLPIDHVPSTEGYRVSEATARTTRLYGGSFFNSYYAFYPTIGNPLGISTREGWVNASGGRDDLKSGAFASVGVNEDDQQMLEIELNWPSSALTGGGPMNDHHWVIVGPSRIEYSSLPVATGGTPNGFATSSIYSKWAGISAARNTYTAGTYTLWTPGSPTAAYGFDPRDPDELETGAYIMLMVNTGALLNATPGSYVERPIAYGGDKVKQIDLGQPFEPESLSVFINGRKYREDKGDFEIVYSGESATGFNVSKGTNPVRPRGLRNYKPRVGKAVRDMVVVRYRVA
jgi:hypothetical protein